MKYIKTYFPRVFKKKELSIEEKLEKQIKARRRGKNQ